MSDGDGVPGVKKCLMVMECLGVKECLMVRGAWGSRSA